MTRLTKEMRSQIIANAVEKAGLNQRREALTAKRAEWAENVRIDSVGGVEKHGELIKLQDQYQALAARIPLNLRSEYSGFIAKRGSFSLNLAGARLKVNEYEGSKIAPREHTITADNPLVQQFYDLEAEERAIDSEKDRISVNVRAVIEQANTIKQLLDMWPECVELLPAVEERKATLPTVKLADLNALVGLPTDAMK